MAQYPHLIVPTPAETRQFTSPNSVRSTFNRPDRQRGVHAQALISKIEAIEPVAEERVEAQKAAGIDKGNGIYLTFESEPNFPLKFESLDLAASGVELCTVKTLPDNRMQATLFVPDGKLGRFLTRIEAYRDEQTLPRREGGPTRPRNQDLVESISDIKLAALEGLWMEETLPFPEAITVTNWEVWLRNSSLIDHLGRLRQYAPTFNLEVGEQVVKFVDRTVVVVRGTATDLSKSAEILGMIAELHVPKTTAAFFTDMEGIEQQEWVDSLAARIQSPSDEAPYVCLFDTGLNHPHPLLMRVVTDEDRHAYKPQWGVDDRDNHGTPMAGLSSFGDLTEALTSVGDVVATHRIESVKIVHQPDPHHPDLYGAVTQESTYRVEVIPDRRRIYCMAVTALDGRERGRPSSWSAAVDALASGQDDGQRRLMIISAGNTDPAQRRYYPHSNMTDGIHDPAQAWNALTVGGYTEKAIIDAARFPGWQPLALAGDLSPCSCTSTTWGKWPIKPDIVMEAGNMGRNPAFADPDYIDDGLQLLSTGNNVLAQRPLTSFGDTSAATALAARLAAMAWAKYPALTPESIRALTIHSARWTPAMLARFTDQHQDIDYRSLLRCFGYGVPSQQRVLSSLDNSLTMFVQGDIQPFYKDEETGRVKTRELRLHDLPWPTAALEALQNIEVTMRVTLSYFVEPSPGARGWTPRYGYQSHGLRFSVKKPLESSGDFQRRINRYERDETYISTGLSDPGWQFGHSQRSLTSLGSVHSDVWRGTAIDLAARKEIAVYPTMGWWNKRQQLGGWEKTARYSLLVTLETPHVEVDLYTPVATQIGVPIVIET
jgi:hypothetical protein